MPFQFSPYESPYVQSISALMMKPAEAQAQAAQNIGAVRAQAAQQSGQAWAGAAQGVGNAVANTVQQYNDPKIQLARLQTAEMQKSIADHNTFKGILKNTPQIQENGMNLYDLPSLGEQSVKAGIDPSPYLVEYGKVNDAFRAESAARMATIQTAAQALAKAPDPDLAKNFLDMAGRNRTIDAATISRLKSAIDAAPTPEDQAAVVKRIAVAYAGPQTPLKLAGAQRAGAAPETAINPLTHEVIATGAAAGPAPPTAESVALAAVGVKPGETPTPEQAKAAVDLTQQPAMAGRETAAAAQAELARHNQELERIQSLQVGRESAANAETARHNKAMEQANNPLGALLQGGGQATPEHGAAAQPANPTGDAVLATVPPQIASTVKALAEGRMAFPAGFALKSPYWQSMIALVGQYDPTFDAVNYNSRSKTRADFTSGAAAKNINALNTVAQHMNILSDSADALSNTWSPAYNTIANFVSKQSGSPVVTNFETAKKAVVDELTRVWRQSGGSAADIAERSKVLDAANSPAQLHGAISQMGQLIEGKLSALESQYKQGMGTSEAGVNVITSAARAVLDKLEQRSGGSQPAAVEQWERGPDGKLRRKSD